MSLGLTATELARIVDGELQGDPSVVASHVITDTRGADFHGAAFVGLVGPNFDGGRFAGDALRRGSAVALVQRSGGGPEPANGQAVVRVQKTTTALQQLAAWHRARFSGTVVGITGSNGKTTVKEMLLSVLGTRYRVAASPMSWNSQVGVALSLLQVPPDVDFALIECGISLTGEMAHLQRMVRPDVGVFVNVGDAHRATLGNASTTAREKAMLFAGSAGDPIPVFVPEEEEYAAQALRQAGARLQLVTSETASVDATGRTMTVRVDDTERTVSLDPLTVTLEQDLRIAATVGASLGVTANEIGTALARWRPAAMRLERLITPVGVHVLNDAYTSDPQSVALALTALANEPGEGRKIVVLSALEQVGRDRRRVHEELGALCANANLDVLYLVGSDASEIGDALYKRTTQPPAIELYESVSEAGAALRELTEPGDRVLLKGSRPAGLEQMVDALFEPLAPARATIRLDVLRENVRTLRRLLGPAVGLMPVIKSFGYGLDSVRLARTYESCGVEFLAVAYPDEALKLRSSGISTPLLVLNIVPAEAAKVVGASASAQVAAVEQVQALEVAAEAAGVVQPVHLKVDTGMGRSGVDPADAGELADRIMASPWLNLEGVMTHLAAADEPGQDAFTRQQLAEFDQAVQALRGSGHDPAVVHAANSAGALRFPESRYTLVRSGIGLLGYADCGQEESELRPVLRIESRIVGVRELQPGHPVGYGMTWRVGDTPRRVAVVAFGYNDGYPRHLSNKGWMTVRGHRAPVVGNVCMDVTMIDVTDVPGDLELGERVVVYGTEEGEPPLTDMATRAGTIAYELLTRISPRVRRIYTDGG